MVTPPGMRAATGGSFENTSALGGSTPCRRMLVFSTALIRARPKSPKRPKRPKRRSAVPVGSVPQPRWLAPQEKLKNESEAMEVATLSLEDTTDRAKSLEAEVSRLQVRSPFPPETPHQHKQPRCFV